MSAASLPWDGMRKYTCVMLELLTEVDFLSFCEFGLRGGGLQCSNRFGKANHRYMGNFDSSKDTSNLLNIDCNLYGNSLMQSLPIGGFKWVENL